jgi:S1-C subfamily serine protease
MIEIGRPRRQPRPWLGIYTAEQSDHVIVAGLTRDGPAHRAGLHLGDAIVAVAGQRISSLPQFLRGVWSTGAAGAQVALTLARGRESLHVSVNSASREDFLKKPSRH